MKYSISISLILAVLVSSCCRNPKVTRHLVNKENGIWLPDSVWSGFTMRSSTGISILYENRFSDSFYESSFSGRRCRQFENEGRNVYYEATLTSDHMEVSHSGGFDGDALRLRINDVVVLYNFMRQEGVNVSNGKRTLTISIVDLDSFAVQGQIFRDVKKLEVTNKDLLANHEACILYLAKEYGIVRYDELSGIFWEQMP